MSDGADRPAGLEVTVGDLDEPTRAAVVALAEAETRARGVAPLSEQALLRVRRGGQGTTHVVARRDGEVVGYVLLAPGGEAADLVAEVAVDPRRPRHEVGGTILRAALDEAGRRAGVTTLRLWSHGDAADEAALAAELGFTRDRVLLQMSRPTALALPAAVVPAGVRLRAFRPGVDDDAWVALNARAFAGHPEQAYVTVDDLRERAAEPWFDPAGFFLAEREADGRLLGFHWTKVHPGVDGGAPVGEVYVVGVDPDAQGSGLGLVLTVTGLAHLASLGLETVILYADESNAGAVRMYERLGFTTSRTDVEHAHLVG